jgi:hypothetical protein
MPRRVEKQEKMKTTEARRKKRIKTLQQKQSKEGLGSTN